MARKFHGIKKAYYGTSSPASTEINKLANEGGAEACRIEFLDQEGNPVDVYGNQYAGVQYTRWVLQFLDPTAGAAIRTNWLADTKQAFKAEVDNSETWTTGSTYLVEFIRPVTIQGRAQGRADGWELAVRIPYSDITIA